MEGSKYKTEIMKSNTKTNGNNQQIQKIDHSKFSMQNKSSDNSLSECSINILGVLESPIPVKIMVSFT